MNRDLIGHRLMKYTLLVLLLLAKPATALVISLDSTSSGEIFDGGLSLFEPRTRHARPLDFVGFYSFSGGMPSMNGAWTTTGYVVFDPLPLGFTVTSASVELEIDSLYLQPISLPGFPFPNGAASLALNVFDGPLIDELLALPEGDIRGQNAVSALEDASRASGTRSIFSSVDGKLPLGVGQFDLSQAAVAALNEGSGRIGVSLSLSGIIEGRMNLGSVPRLILEGSAAQITLPSTIALVLIGLTLTVRRRTVRFSASR